MQKMEDVFKEAEEAVIAEYKRFNHVPDFEMRDRIKDLEEMDATKGNMIQAMRLEISGLNLSTGDFRRKIQTLELQVKEFERKLEEYKEKAWMYDQLNK